jgi:replication factor C small subunit
MPLGGGFKIIYLDEADSLTKDAQHALRRMMEKYADTARFILACNYSSKVIPPIQSRCAVFRFSQLNEAEMKKFLERVSKEENLDIDDEAYKAVIYASEGDMRRAINILQTASMSEGKMTEEVIYSVTNSPDPLAVKKMITHAMEGNFREARKSLLALMFEQGLAGEDIIKEIHSQVFELDIPDTKKLSLIEKVGEYEFRLTEGSNATIQLEALLAQFGKKE